ncbi:MAG TPA: membrane protein insertase YidC, partial [Roseovarius nubinhibens]|nr:membrane protein insertase YidC [Roseovarius nubinhibens]
MDDQNKNLILASILSLLVIIIWTVLFPAAETDLPADTATTTASAPAGDTALTPGSAGGEVSTETTAPAEPLPESAPRVAVETPSVTGSISLRGGRLDELALNNYRESLDPGAEIVTLLNPTGSASPYYALFGWAPGTGLNSDAVPGANTLWSVETGETLTPDSPVTLLWENGQGLTFRREISVDAKYMFTIRQTVENTGDAAPVLAPYGIIARHGEPADLKNFFILHEGAVQMADGELNEIDYDDFEGAGNHTPLKVATNGWTGFTDHYWMTTLIPRGETGFDLSTFQDPRRNIYQTTVKQPAITLEPGQTAEATTQLFAGAKEWETIRNYQNKGGVDKFLDSI